MSDLTQELKILLRTIADLTGINEVRNGIQATTTEIEAAAAASSGFGTVLAGALGGAAVLGVGALIGELLQIPSLISQSREEWRRVDEETTKATAQLSEQIVIWDQLASGATKFSDVVSLAGKGVAELTKLSKELEEAQNKQLSTFRQIQDAFGKGGGNDELGGPSDDTRGTNAGARADNIQRRKDNLAKGFDELIAKEDKANAAFSARMDRLNEPPTQALQETTAELTKQEVVLDSIDRRTLDGQKAYASQLKVVENLRSETEKFGKGQEKASQEEGDFSLKQRQSALDEARLRGENVDAAQHQLSVEEKIAQLTKSKAEALKDGRITQADITGEAEREVTVTEQKRAAAASNRSNAEAERDAHRDIAHYLQEESLLLQQSRQKQQLVQQNPLLTDGEKSTALAQIMGDQIDLINQKIAEGKDKLAHGVFDPATYDQATKAISGLQFRADSLKQTLAGGSFVGQLRAQFVALDSQLELTGKKLGAVITGSLQTAINGVSQGITGLITGATTFGQAMGQALSAVIGQFVQLGVETAAYYAKVLIHWAVQRAAASANRAADVTEHVAAETTKASASTLSALLSSISSYGWAAIVGLAAVVAAIGYFAVSGFESGGHTGGVEGRPAGVVHGEEFVFSAPATRRIGVATLEAMHNDFSGFEGGGFVGAAAAKSPSLSSRSSASNKPSVINQALFLDPREAVKWLLQTPEGERHITDIVRRNKHKIGIPT